MRYLPTQLKEFIDLRLNGQLCLSPTELLTQAAIACVGVTEVGENSGPMVSLFQSAVSRPQGQPWCLDYLQACIAYVEAATGVKSQIPATEHVMTLWNQAKNYAAVSPPRVGDLILWRFGDTDKGHCGLIIGQDSLRYRTVEGNTSDSADIERNGDGVYVKNRAKGGSKTFVEVGFLRVFP